MPCNNIVEFLTVSAVTMILVYVIMAFCVRAGRSRHE